MERTGIFSLYNNRTIQSFQTLNPSFGEELWELDFNAVQGGTITFSPLGKMLAAGGTDGRITLWDVSTSEPKEIRLLSGGQGTITQSGLDFSPDSKTLVSGSYDLNFIRFWNVSNGKILNITLIGQMYGVVTAKYSPSGTLLLTGDASGGINIWNTTSWERITNFQAHSGPVTSASFLADGTLVATSGDSTAKIWNTSTWKLEHTLVGHPNYVGDLSFSPDGKFLGVTSASSGSSTFWLWDWASEYVIFDLEGHKDTESIFAFTSLKFSPNGMVVASGGLDGVIKLWDPKSGTEIQTLGDHTADVTKLAFSPDGTLLASISLDSTIKLYTVIRGAERQSFSWHSSAVRSVAYSPTTTLLASGGEDSTVRLWNLTSGMGFQTPLRHDGSVTSVDFSPNGTILASGSWDNKIKLWNSTSGMLKRNLTGHTDFVYSVDFSPNGKVLASGSKDATVKLWNVSNGEELHTFSGVNGHIASVFSVTYSFDGRMVVTGSEDTTVKLWNTTSGEWLQTLSGTYKRGQECDLFTGWFDGGIRG
jgi:WD40 repeat protein